MISIKRTILGISDLKTLFQSIKSKYSIDFSNYAISSFKRRLEDFMDHYHIQNFDDLIHRIENDKDFFKLFISFQMVDTTEMFRDPEFWEELKDII
jgi:chemotaxis protein methyltransferase CheR